VHQLPAGLAHGIQLPAARAEDSQIPALDFPLHN
jgi:hypothetical protein